MMMVSLTLHVSQANVSTAHGQVHLHYYQQVLLALLAYPTGSLWCTHLDNNTGLKIDKEKDYLINDLSLLMKLMKKGCTSLCMK